jgi:hypothetical protein
MREREKHFSGLSVMIHTDPVLLLTPFWWKEIKLHQIKAAC